MLLFFVEQMLACQIRPGAYDLDLAGKIKATSEILDLINSQIQEIVNMDQ